MKDIGLIDIDSKIPNLALMQISAYHKAKGDTVHFGAGEDKTYLSCVFPKNRARAISASKLCGKEVVFGGSGFNYEWLPIEMWKVKPDYNLYPSTYSQGFTTRGCIRRCPFCIVPAKEGHIQKWQHPSEFYDERFDTIMLMDNNWLAIPEWFEETAEWIIEHDLILIEHGLDIRLLNAQNVKILNRLHIDNSFHFAWDNIEDENAIIKGLDLLRKAGINPRNQVQFYVLVGFNTTPDQDKYRCRRLKEMGTNAFVMPFILNDWTRRLARWANRRWLFWSCDIDDYLSPASEERGQEKE